MLPSPTLTNQSVSLLFGDGRGKFSQAHNIRVGDGPVSPPWHRFSTDHFIDPHGQGVGIVGLDAGDLNEDGKQDLLATSSYDGHAYVLLNKCQ